MDGNHRAALKGKKTWRKIGFRCRPRVLLFVYGRGRFRNRAGEDGYASSVSFSICNALAQKARSFSTSAGSASLRC